MSLIDIRTSSVEKSSMLQSVSEFMLIEFYLQFVALGEQYTNFPREEARIGQADTIKIGRIF